jgi:uncharacterized protein (DUF2384 family)
MRNEAGSRAAPRRPSIMGVRLVTEGRAILSAFPECCVTMRRFLKIQEKLNDIKPSIEYSLAMATPSPVPSADPDSTAVLTKAVIRAAALLELTQRNVAETLGLSGPTASRLFTGKYRLSPTRSKEWELAVLFVRLFRSLDALWGHDATGRTWLRTYNTALGAEPLEMMRTATGLVRVVDYLDHARGRV